jgi:hypothetical protein
MKKAHQPEQMKASPAKWQRVLFVRLLRRSMGLGRPGIVVVHLEHGSLGSSILAELIQIVGAAGLGFILFSLSSALGFIPLFLLPCLLFLTLRKCRSASWHPLSPSIMVIARR